MHAHVPRKFSRRGTAFWAAALVALSLASCKSNDKSSDDTAGTTATKAPTSPSDAAPAKEPAVPLAKLPSDPNADLGLDPGVTHGVLDNGLHYYIKKNAKPENRAQFWVSIDAGSYQEEENQRGLAHFLEHMAFNGTKSFPKNELIAKLRELGVEFGPHLNASTSFDETIYKLQLPTDKPETIKLGLQILSEWAGAITLDPEEFEKERGVVLAEKRGGEGAQMRLAQGLISQVFAGTRYANRLPIGLPKVLKKAPISAIRQFYEDWYHPANTAVYVVGDIDPAQIQTLIKEQFSGTPAKENPKVAPERTLPTNSEFQFLTMQDSELPLTAVALGRLRKKSPSKSTADQRKSYVELLATMLVSKRMEEAQKRGTARYLMAGGSPAPLVRNTEAVLFFAMLNPLQVQEGLTDLLDEIERARRYGFTQPELDRANEEITSILKSRAKEAAAGKEDSAALVAELTNVHLAGEAMPGRDIEVALVTQFAKTVKVEELPPVLSGFLAPQGLIVASIGSAAKDSLSKKSLLALLKALPEKALEPWSDTPNKTRLLSTKPTPGSVVSKTLHKETGVHEWKLSNGATFILKPTDFQTDEIIFSAMSPGGKGVLPAGELAAVHQTARIVDQSGIGEFDAIALQRILAGKNVTMGPIFAADSEELSGASGQEDLETMFTLAHLYFTAPRRDEKSFTILKKNAKTEVAQASNSPETRFFYSIAPLRSNKNPRMVVWDEKTAEAMDFEKSMNFYSDRMRDAGDFQFFLVGSFQVDEVEALVNTYIASLPSGERRETVIPHPWPGYSKRSQLTKRDGSQPRAAISFFFDREYQGKQGPSASEKVAWKLFGDAATMHFLALFREELGETYSVRMQTRWGQRWTHTIATLALQCATENAGPVQKRAEATLATLVQTGVSEEYFSKAKAALLKRNEVNLKTNTFWMKSLGRIYFNQGELSEILDQKRVITETSLEMVHKAAKDFIAPNKAVIGVLLPKK